MKNEFCSKMHLYVGKEGLCAIMVSSLTDMVYLLNESGGRPASAQRLSAGLDQNIPRARRRHVFWAFLIRLVSYLVRGADFILLMWDIASIVSLMYFECH